MLDRVNRLIRSRGGNVAVTFALCLAPLTASVGGAIDFTRSVTIGTEVQSALDSGVLAAASLTQSRTPEEVVRAYIEAAIAEHNGVIESLVVTVNSDVALNARQVTAEAVVSVPTLLLGMAGIKNLSVVRTAEALEQVKDVEISLVLDISSSMNGSKIDSLREAALDFVDTVLEGQQGELTSISVVPYGGTVKLDDTFFDYLDPSLETFTPDGMGYAAAMPDAPEDWNGCLEMGWADVVSIDLEEGAHGVLPTFTVWNAGNNWCPDYEGAETVFLTNDKTKLNDLISTFDNPVLSDGTGTDIATSWGVRALDPVWRGRLNGASEFDERPADYGDNRTLKVMVVMTDGGITSQMRPEPWWEEGEDDPHVRTSGVDDLYSKNRASRNFTEMCDYAKDNGVQVYTIAFQLSGSSNRDLLRDCASKPAQYYDVQDLNIGAAFSAIAADLNRLRLTQ